MVAMGRAIEVRGGTTRDNRHSKVYTSKGPKDRRVRLSALTAIQFYDVQDRLGCERPSEAVDWLLHKAKASIEALAHQHLGSGDKHPTETWRVKEEFSPWRNLEHAGAHSINGLPSSHLGASSTSISDGYVCMENSSSMLGFDYDYSGIMLQEEEESMLVRNSWVDQAALNPFQRQRMGSMNHKLSPTTGGDHVQVCSLFQSTTDAPFWRVHSAGGEAFPGNGVPSNKHS